MKTKEVEIISASSINPNILRTFDPDDDDYSGNITEREKVETEDVKSLDKKESFDDPMLDDEAETVFTKKSKNKRILSDSESDADVKETVNDDCSDSRADVWEVSEPKKVNEDHIDEPEKNFKKKFLDSDIYDAEGSSDDEGQLKISDEAEENIDISKKKKKEKKDKAKKSFLDSDIYDAEGSSDEGQLKISDHEGEANVDISKKKNKEKKDKTKKSNLPRKSKQTAIEEIRSETQRLVRQSRISLPYHRPKQRSLSEFLDRRKSLPVVPLKTSTDELSKVWEKIEEREKTAESFYKSESDASDGEPSSALVKLNDEKINKSTTENENIIQESTPELCLHYTETESQEIQDEPKSPTVITKEYGSLSSLNSGGSLTQIVIETDSKLVEAQVSSDHKLVFETRCDNIDININNQYKENVSELEKDLAATLEEEFNCGSIIQNKDPEISVKYDISGHTSADIKPESQAEDSNVNKIEHKILNRSNILNPDVKLNKVPRLSGQPDEVIDLEKSPEKPGAVKLISRFMKHITLKPKVKVQQNVVVAISEVNENGEIVNIKEETVEIKRKEESLKIKVGDTSKPGETRMKLKATLRHKIAQCREQQVAKRLEESKLDEEEIFGEDEKPDYEEEAEELTASESESDSDEVEDDVIINDDVKEKNPFVDEEAEESENDEEVIDVNEGSDADEYSDAPSVDLASLVDKDEEIPHLDADIEGGGSQRNDDLMALCSGGFTSQPINLNDLEQNDLSFTQLDTNAKDLDTSFSPSSIQKEQINSLNENETTVVNEESDEEITITKKKKKLKLTFSDDEDDNNDPDDDESNPISLDGSENGDTVNLANIEYDDNEEIVLSGEDEEDAVEIVEDEEEAEYAKVTKKAAKRFLEAEAELSGSEWGSADEDELDLDVMEKEEGDEDVINQRKVRSELEKIHMKELLDEDKREIRALQELFLEDGELHSDGPKRQRQFRWYNQDGDNENGSFLTNIDGELKDGEDEEEDESWRKTRLERENFLRNLKHDDTEISDDNVKFLKFAKKPVLKPSPKLPQPKFTSPDPRKQFSLVSRRGSFLSRGEKLLSKLAEITNVSSENPLGNVRGQRNMVFAVVSPPKEEPKEMPLKRKSTSSYPVGATKKLKFSPPSNQPGGSLFDKLKMVD